MKTQLTLMFCAVLLSGAGYAANDQVTLHKQLESVSAHIGNNTDERAVANSLYHQIRGHVQITRHDLKRTEVDKRIHDYIAKKYIPILLLKYSEVFEKMQEANRHFSDCHKLQPFTYSSTAKAAMCTVRSHAKLYVHYLVNENNKGWEKTSEFVFRPEHHSLRLVAIKLNLKKHQKVHVDGI